MKKHPAKTKPAKTKPAKTKVVRSLGFWLLGFLILALAACSQEGASPGGANLDTLAAPNLVTNPGFSGTNGWSSYFNAPATGSFSVVDGAAKVNIKSADGVDWKVQLYQNVLVQQSAGYSLTFKARATGARALRVALRDSSTYNDVWSKTVNLTTSTQTFGPFSFSASAASNRQLIFYLGQNSRDVFLDDVVFTAGGASTPPGGGSKTYPYGGTLVPAGTDANKVVSDLYAKWKSANLAYAPNKGLRSGEILLKSPGGQFSNGMVSEGIGYGMLLSVYNNDKATFDGIWKFAKRNLNAFGLMPWLYDSNSRVVDSNNATDGDLDAAFALIVASKKGWGYDQDAKNLVNALMTHCVNPGDLALERGQANNPKNVINTDYFSPGYFKVFAQFTGDNRWIGARDANYSTLRKALDQPNVVLQPQEVRTDGVVVNDVNTYGSDTARAPWRLATDYVWYGDDRAQTILKGYNSFFESAKAGGLSNLCESYDRYGNKLGGWCGSDAGWMIQGAASAQLAENDGAARREAWNALTTAYTGDYYSFELMQLGILLTSGRFYNPLQ